MYRCIYIVMYNKTTDEQEEYDDFELSEFEAIDYVYDKVFEEVMNGENYS